MSQAGQTLEFRELRLWNTALGAETREAAMPAFAKSWRRE
jgi:hypothetical protein